MGRAHYYSRMAVAPDNENEAYFLDRVATASRSTAARRCGDSRARDRPGRRPPRHVDRSDQREPDDRRPRPGRRRSRINRGRTWYRNRLPNAQMYHVTVDNQIPYNVYGNKQDGPSYRGPSNSRLQGGCGGGSGIPRSDVARGRRRRERLGDARPGRPEHRLVDAPPAPAASAASSRATRRAAARRATSRCGRTSRTAPPADLKYRFIWTLPLHDLAARSQHGLRRQPARPPDDERRPELAGDQPGPDAERQERGSSSPAGSRRQHRRRVRGRRLGDRGIADARQGVIWAGTNDGLVQVTRDGGKTWTNVTKNIPDLPPWGTVRNIEPSRYDAGTAYLTVDVHQVNNRDPFVYKTTDYGKTLEADRQRHPAEHAQLRALHPRGSGAARAALPRHRERASTSRSTMARTGSRCRTNLPHAPVYWHRRAGTLQRSGDRDLRPRLLDPRRHHAAAAADAAGAERRRAPVPAAAGLPVPRDHARRPRLRTIRPSGENPPYGASINYYLKSAPPADVTITILNPEGEPVVRTLRRRRRPPGSTASHWDLRVEPTTEVRLRTSPLYCARGRRSALTARDPRQARGRLSISRRRELHRPAERRRQAAHAEARRPQGSELRAAPTPTSSSR